MGEYLFIPKNSFFFFSFLYLLAHWFFSVFYKNCLVFFFTIILRDHESAILRVGAPTVECGSVRLVALGIWALAVEWGSAKLWVCWRYHPKVGKIILPHRRMLLLALEKETKAWVSPTHAKPFHLHQIQFFFFFSFGSTLAAWKIRRWKEGGQ